MVLVLDPVIVAFNHTVALKYNFLIITTLMCCYFGNVD